MEVSFGASAQMENRANLVFAFTRMVVYDREKAVVHHEMVNLT